MILIQNIRVNYFIFLVVVSLFSLNSYGNGVEVERTEHSVVLKNDAVRLIFADSSHFAIREIVINGYKVTTQRNNVHPWLITYRGRYGENPILSPRFADYKGVKVIKQDKSATLAFEWSVMLTDSVYPVQMFISLKDKSELPEWRIEAGLPSEWVITNLEFPRIPILRFSQAKAILPAGYGVEYSIAETRVLQSRYPSCTGTMQLLLIHNKNGAIYYSTKDKQASDKTLKIKSEGKSLILSSDIIASYAWSTKGKFVLPWTTVVGFDKSGWQSAVEKWYRPFTFETEWGRKKITERNNIAKWIENADLWLRPMHVKDETITDLKTALTYFGKNTGVHWYYWHKHPFDTKYPEYFPAKTGFSEMIKETQQNGGFVTPYINGRLWDPTTKSYTAKDGAKASCRKADGTLYTEVYGSKVLNTVTCPASDVWKSIQKDLIYRIIDEIGANGVYIDQIAAARNEPCYANNHQHAKGGGSWWHYAYRNLIDDVRTTILKKEQAITSEENAECYIDLFDMLLIVNTPHTKHQKIVPLFPLVYSDRAVYSGYTYIPWNMTNGSLNYITMRSLLWGAQLGWVAPKKIMEEKAKKEAKLLKDLALFRKKQHDLFFGGRFVREIIPQGDNPISAIPNYQKTNVVLGAEWISVSGDRVYIIVNIDDKQHKITLPNNKELTINAMSADRVIK